jgi:hypothetical protein
MLLKSLINDLKVVTLPVLQVFLGLQKLSQVDVKWLIYRDLIEA